MTPQEKIKIIAIIREPGGHYEYVINRDMKYIYTKIDRETIIGEDEGYFLDHMVFSNNEWDWTYATIPSHWMPIPKLPKE